MNEEEKKAIEFMEEYKDVVYRIPFKIILNLIDKQQKEIDTYKETENDYEHELARKDEEIEELKKENIELSNQITDGYWENDRLKNEIEQLNEIKQQICNEELITQDYVQENFIKKDKIREKIRQREHIIHNAKLEHGKDYEMYEDTHSAREEIALYRELLEE